MTGHRRRAEPVSRRARFQPCPRCDALVIRALDADVAALDIRLDPTPLCAAAEIRALLSGVATYDLVKTGYRYEIIRRNQFRITRRAHPILPVHQCPGPVPVNALATTRPAKKETRDEEPPF